MIANQYDDKINVHEKNELPEESIIDDKLVDLLSTDYDCVGDNRSQDAGNEKDVDNDSAHDHEDQSGKVISKKETKNVLFLKLLVCFILVTSAFTIASIVYVYVTRSESSTFESNFNDDAYKVLEAIGSSLDRTLGVLDSVSVLYVSHAQQMGDEWPFVTLPNFEAKMAKLFPLTDVLKVYFLPMVYPDQLAEWGRYSLQMNSWVNETISFQETWEGFYGHIRYNWTAFENIHDDFGDIESNVR